MRAHEFLIEDDKIRTFTELRLFKENFKNLIITDCNPFYNDVNKFTDKRLILYRGTNDRIEFYEKLTPDKDREPRDTSTLLHNAVNLVMKHLGFVARRDNCFFAAGSKHGLVHNFGRQHVVIPIGTYNYTWSPTILDFSIEDTLKMLFDYGALYLEPGTELDINSLGDGLHDDYLKFHSAIDEGIIKINPAKLTSFIEKNYTTGNIKEAILSGNEIIMRSQSYYLVNRDFFFSIDW